MELLKFKNGMFNNSESEALNVWHLMNDAEGQQGEFTLCGIAFDGDATSPGLNAQHKNSGSVTCKKCLSIIKLCKSVK